MLKRPVAHSRGWESPPQSSQPTPTKDDDPKLHVRRRRMNPSPFAFGDSLKLVLFRYFRFLRSNKKERVRLGVLIVVGIWFIVKFNPYVRQIRRRVDPVDPKTLCGPQGCSPRAVLTSGLGQLYRINDRNTRHFLSLKKQAINPPLTRAQAIALKDKKEKEAKELESKERKESRKYKGRLRDSMYEGDCVPMRSWQEQMFPSCNKMHEIDVADVASSRFSSLAEGGYNDVFKVRGGDDDLYVMKILRQKNEYTEKHFDRARRDAMIMERTTASPFVMDIHSYCGFATLVPFGEDKLDGFLWRHQQYMTQEEKLQLAIQTSMGLAAVHDIDGDGVASLTHGDFASKQFILVNGVWKLGDFNRGRFLKWNTKYEEACPYTVGNNDGTFRAPEEYKYDPQTASMDVFSLGSLLYKILTGEGVWDDVDTKEARERIIEGELPPLDKKLKLSRDPIDIMLMKAMDMCFTYDPRERPTAPFVLNFLQTEAERLGIEPRDRFVLEFFEREHKKMGIKS